MVSVVAVYKLRIMERKSCLVAAIGRRLFLPALGLMREAGQEPDSAEGANRDPNQLRAMFKIRALHLLACFALVYVGTEVTLGGIFQIILVTYNLDCWTR